MVPKLLEKNIDMNNVFVTIIDSDTLVPEMYMDQIETHVEQNYEKRHNFVYQAPQFFTSN